MTDPVDAILDAHGCRGAWAPLPATGVANRIYATADVVLRIATNHPDAISDAYTESVAAPLARRAGIRTPRLLVFDDSRALVDRPFSIWDRVHGETLGRAGLDFLVRQNVWREVGHELDRLHTLVRACDDPQGHLDTPGYELNLASTLSRLVDAEVVTGQLARDIETLLDELAPHVAAPDYVTCFVHNDVHEMNIMCSTTGGLLALIDWGDAGWGDPALDFAAVPLEMLPAVFSGYGAANLSRLGAFPEARVVWSMLHSAMDDAVDVPGAAIPLTAFRNFLGSLS